METKLKIFVDRLTQEKSENIDETIPATLLNVSEPFLTFSGVIKIQGETYIASDHLVIQLTVDALAEIPCSICNDRVTATIFLKKFYQTEEISQIKGHVYDYFPLLREAILLEVPDFVECNGNCKKRTDLKNYLKPNITSKKSQKEHVNFPFANLK